MSNEEIENKLEIFDEFIEHYIKSNKTIFKITCTAFILFFIPVAVSDKAPYLNISSIQIIDRFKVFNNALITPEFGFSGTSLLILLIIMSISIPLFYSVISQSLANLKMNTKLAITRNNPVNIRSSKITFMLYSFFMQLNCILIFFITALSTLITLKILNLNYIHLLLTFIIGWFFQALAITTSIRAVKEIETLANLQQQEVLKPTWQEKILSGLMIVTPYVAMTITLKYLMNN